MSDPSSPLSTTPSADELKKQVGEAVLDYVRSGMKLGIGTGSTAEAFIRAMATKIEKDGLDIIGVPTSERTRALCEQLGVPLTTLEDTPELDLTIDGADEIDPALNLIKGGGGALLREKIVAAASLEMLVIADESKLVPMLGDFPLPIEVNAFGLSATREMIEKAAKAVGLGGTLQLRTQDSGQNFVTDGGHFILDASFGRIADPNAFGMSLNAIPGVVEHGLFTGLATRAIIATENGISVVEPE